MNILDRIERQVIESVNSDNIICGSYYEEFVYELYSYILTNNDTIMTTKLENTLHPGYNRQKDPTLCRIILDTIIYVVKTKEDTLSVGKLKYLVHNCCVVDIINLVTDKNKLRELFLDFKNSGVNILQILTLKKFEVMPLQVIMEVWDVTLEDINREIICQHIVYQDILGYINEIFDQV